MSSVAIALFVGVNLLLIFVLLGAPLGVRSISVSVTARAPRRRLWDAIWPLGADAGWSGEIVDVQPVPGSSDEVRTTLSWEGREGKPIERTVRLDDVVDAEAFSMRVTNDTALDDAFWADFREDVRLSEAGGATTVTMSQTDRYRGLAFLVFRYFRMRRQLGRLKSWAETGRFRRTGIFEHPMTQFGFAGLSVLALWPLFGLDSRGLIFAVTLTTVVALHELGHLAAFRLMGHRRVRMIFIPILGGVAIGGRPYDSRFEVAFVSLMGAGFSAFLVPIAIEGSMVTAHAGHVLASEVLAIFAACAAFFNLSNLVPVWRFDGGQVLRQILPGKASLAVAAFVILSAFLLVGRMIGFSDDVLIVSGAVFAVLSLITVGTTVKPRTELKPIGLLDRLLMGAGLVAVFAIHGLGVVWAARTLL